jgi:hypothetical protein
VPRTLLTADGDAAEGAAIFSLELLGGATLRRCRKLRPEVEALPWGTLRGSGLPEDLAQAVCEGFAFAAFQEYRGAAVCAETVRALLGARAPLDLITTCSRFLVDETTHAELYARLSAELGSAPAMHFSPDQLVPRGPSDGDARSDAAELLVRYYCVGEAVSEPLLRLMWRRARHPLVRGALRILVRDEAAHAQFGWTALDWAAPGLSAEARRRLGRAAREMIVTLVTSWGGPAPDASLLGWPSAAEYGAVGRQALAERVLPRLRALGIDPGGPPR